MADRGEAPGPSRQDKGKAKVGEPSAEINEPGPVSGLMVRADEKEHAYHNPPRSVPRSLAKKDMFLSIALTSQQVDEAYPKLNLSATEAFLLTNRLEVLEVPPGRFSENLAMTDMLDNRYSMTISNHNSGSPSRFLVNTEWGRFVHLNKLKERDKLEFYRLLDHVSGQACYVLRPVKNLDNLEPSSFSVDNQFMRLLTSPEPSVAPLGVMEPIVKEDQSVLLKILTSQDTDPINPMLYIDASEAYTLTNSVNFLMPTSVPNPMMLCAFYEGDQAYNLRLSYCSINRYSISQDWGLFVRVHKLKAGDQIRFYRRPMAEGMDPVYELKYVRREEPEKAQPLNLVDLKRKQSPNSSFSDDNKIRRIFPSLEPSGDIKHSPQVPWSAIPKTLTAQDTNLVDPVLYINASEAYSLTGSFKLLNPTPTPSPVKLPVFEGNRVYNMLLSYLTTNKYSITQDWGHFVRRHKLRAGDQILFYRYPTADTLSSSYEIQIVRREESKIITQPPKLIDLNRQSSPNSRGTPIPAYKLSKTLSVHQGSIMKLWFDAIEAWILTGCVRVLDDCPCGTILMNLLVYDERNSPYDMVLTHMKHTNGKVLCTLDAGWHRFVDSQGLKAGDRVTICNIKGEKYYTLEYTRSGLLSGRGASRVGPSGSGQ